MLPGSDPPSIFAIATFNNRVRDGSEWFHYIISTRKALKTFNPVSAFSLMLSLMRCISFARLNYLIKFSLVCQPQSQKFFFDRPKPPPIAEFDVLFASGADRPFTHKSQKAASTPCSLRIFPSFTNHATTCLTVNCSIGISASVAICLKGRKDAITKFVKKFSFLASSSIDQKAAAGREY